MGTYIKYLKRFERPVNPSTLTAGRCALRQGSRSYNPGVETTGYSQGGRVKKKGLTITVTGLSGSGKSMVAEAIAKAFKLKTFNAGDLQRKFAKQKKITLDLASKILPKEIDYQMDKAVLAKASLGGYVLTGRLSAWTAGDWADGKVFINCQKKVRVQRVARRDNLTYKEATKKVNQRDQADFKRYWKLYKININQKKIYNIFVNNDKPGRERIKKEVIQKIKDYLKKKGIKYK